MYEKSLIIKFDYSNEQTVGQITKVVGLVKAKYLIPVIDALDLKANPRSSKTGPVTKAITDSIVNDPELFPFKTKGILLAASQYERLERNRIKMSPDDLEIEGILDGGHNTLAIGLYILSEAMSYAGKELPRGEKTWDQFKVLWEENRTDIDRYMEAQRNGEETGSMGFYVPVELLVPRDAGDAACVESFKNDLLEICEARNNNVELNVAAKANQKGFFETLKSMMESRDPELCSRIEWKTNDGGSIKAQEVIALAWIPLSLVSPVKDEYGRTIEPVSANKLYSAKGICLKQFEKLMMSPEVTARTSTDYKRELKNLEVSTAFRVAVELPELYDYIYEVFPELYNAAGGNYGRINAVKRLNEKRKEKTPPFSERQINTLSPEGDVPPLGYGLQALLANRGPNGRREITWVCPPMAFLHENLAKIVKHYYGIISVCDFDPQKVGKNMQSYELALSGFKMALAGIL